MNSPVSQEMTESEEEIDQFNDQAQQEDFGFQQQRNQLDILNRDNFNSVNTVRD